MEEQDAYQTAKLLVDQHGLGAVTYAEQRARDLAADSDQDGLRTWRQIEAAIEVLRLRAPTSEQPIQ